MGVKSSNLLCSTTHSLEWVFCLVCDEQDGDAGVEGELFNLMASYYDSYRPDYPPKAIDTIIKKAQLTEGSRLLEIGSGSGKATALFLNKGFDLTCIDPGEELISLGKAKYASQNVRFISSRLEDYDAPTGYYDAVISAQAFHWISQPIGYTKSAAVLKHAGYLALFWNIDIFQDVEQDVELWSILSKYNAFVACIKEADYPARVKTITDSITESAGFAKPEVLSFVWDKVYDLNGYYGYLMTSQVFFQKPDALKKACFEELSGLLERHGGRIKRRYTCELYLARKI